MYELKYHAESLIGKSFLVTGGAGFIGSHLVEYLLAMGAGKVRVLDNLLTGKKENIAPFFNEPRFEFIEGSVTDPLTCRKACTGIQFVSHQAALGSVPRSVKDPWNTHLNNVDGFLHLLMAAKEAGVQRFVYASSSSVYGDEPNLPKQEDRIGAPLSPYAVSKYTNELYAAVFSRTYQFPTVGLRYFNIFGPRQDPSGMYAAVIPLFVHRMLNQQDIYIDGDGEQTRDFTYVENAVQANVRAFFASNDSLSGQVFNIACGQRYSVNELFRRIAEQLGVATVPLYRETRTGDILNSLADVSKAQRLMGYVPAIQFEEGLRKTVDFFHAQFKNS